MVVGEVVNISGEMLGEVVIEVGKIGLWIQAIGIFIILWICFEVASLIINIMKRRTLKNIKTDLIRIEKKVDKIGKKK